MQKFDEISTGIKRDFPLVTLRADRRKKLYFIANRHIVSQIDERNKEVSFYPFPPTFLWRIWFKIFCRDWVLQDIAVDEDDNLYITTDVEPTKVTNIWSAPRGAIVFKFSTEGKYINYFRGPRQFSQVFQMVIDSVGKIYLHSITCPEYAVIQKIDKNGNVIMRLGEYITPAPDDEDKGTQPGFIHYHKGLLSIDTEDNVWYIRQFPPAFIAKYNPEGKCLYKEQIKQITGKDWITGFTCSRAGILAVMLTTQEGIGKLILWNGFFREINQSSSWSGSSITFDSDDRLWITECDKETNEWKICSYKI